LKVRQGLTGRARSGGQGGIFGAKDAAALPKQGKPRPAAPFAVSDSPVFERQQAKENYADQVVDRAQKCYWFSSYSVCCSVLCASLMASRGVFKYLTPTASIQKCARMKDLP
jgi:hypothetical protein